MRKDIYLENLWYCAALPKDLDGEPFRRLICNQPIVFYRDASGKPVALEDRCSHRHAPLSRGRVRGDRIECAYHGLVFDRRGSCVHIPHQSKIPPRAHIGAYAVEEKWGFLWLWKGDAEDADPALIPDLHWTEDPSRRPVYLYFHVKANFQLVADNLLDISHADYLHASSFGSKSGSMDGPKPGDYEFETWAEAEKVHSVRKLKNVEVGDAAKKWGGFTKKLDRTNIQMWEPPNTIHVRLEFANDENSIAINHDHLMTPETGSTTHYFMEFTREANFGGGVTDDEVYNQQYTIVSTEDLPMVEAQQANIAQYGDALDMPVEADRLINGVHRRLAALYKEKGLSVPAQLSRSSRGH